jgi:hypothetical protein
LFAWPATATAKEIQSAKICGDSGCTTVTDPSSLQLLANGGDGGGPGPVAPAPFYRITLTVQEPAGGPSHHWDVYFVPSAHAIGFQGESGQATWGLLRPASRAAFEAATADVEPYATPHLTRVLVHGRPAADPNSYLRLLTLPGRGPAVPGDHVWQAVDLRTPRNTPWTNGAVTLMIADDGDLLLRGTESVRLPAGLADKVRAGDGLTPGAFPWRTLELAFAAAALAAALLALALRARRLEARRPEPAA